MLKKTLQFFDGPLQFFDGPQRHDDFLQLDVLKSSQLEQAFVGLEELVIDRGVDALISIDASLRLYLQRKGEEEQG